MFPRFNSWSSPKQTKARSNRLNVVPPDLCWYCNNHGFRVSTPIWPIDESQQPPSPHLWMRWTCEFVWCVEYDDAWFCPKHLHKCDHTWVERSYVYIYICVSYIYIYTCTVYRYEMSLALGRPFNDLKGVNFYDSVLAGAKGFFCVSPIGLVWISHRMPWPTQNL